MKHCRHPCLKKPIFFQCHFSKLESICVIPYKMSESESSDISSIDDREEDEEFRPLEVSEHLKEEYNFFAEFEKECATSLALTV